MSCGGVTREYYPFGMLMPGRSYDATTHRYGWNGAEKDDEIAGSGNHYDLGLRHYSPRLGRMFSIDPRATEYPWQTPYAYHRNSPIANVDYLGGGDGDEPEVTNTEVKTEGEADESITSKSEIASQVGLGNGILATVESTQGTFTEIANGRQVSLQLEGIDLSEAKLKETGEEGVVGQKTVVLETDEYTLKFERKAEAITKFYLQRGEEYFQAGPPLTKKGDDSPSAEFIGVVPNGNEGGTIHIYDAPAIKNVRFRETGEVILFQANFKESLTVINKTTGKEVILYSKEWPSQILGEKKGKDEIGVKESEKFPTETKESLLILSK